MAGNPGGTDGVDDITESVDRGRTGDTGATSCEPEPTSESAATEGAGEGEGCGAVRASLFVRSTLLSTGVAGLCGKDEGVGGREDGACEVFALADLRSLVFEVRVSPVEAGV
jgi:hypothetical protein